MIIGGIEQDNNLGGYNFAMWLKSDLDYSYPCNWGLSI